MSILSFFLFINSLLFSEYVPRLEFYPTFALSVIYEFVNNQKRI